MEYKHLRQPKPFPMSQRTRTAILIIILLAAFGFSMSTNGQATIIVDDLPSSLTWNLNEDQTTRSTWEKADYGYPVPDDQWKIWEKPTTTTIYLYYVRPKDFGFSGRFKGNDFIAAMEKLGYIKCPAWVPVQLFLFTRQYRGCGIWIPLQEIKMGEIPRFGCDKSPAFTSSCMEADLYGGNPDASFDTDIWVFTRVQ